MHLVLGLLLDVESEIQYRVCTCVRNSSAEEARGRGEWEISEIGAENAKKMR